MNDTRTYVLNRMQKYVESRKAENIEKSIYNYTIDYCRKKNIEQSWDVLLFSHVYVQKALEVHKLVEDSKVIDKINTKQVCAKDLAFIKHTDLYPEEKVDDVQEEISEGLFQCKRCGSKKTTYYSLQTRSADEPMTNFITCVSCKNRWKM